MSLQDQLRAENLEVADTGTLLTQAADQIDVLEAQVAGVPVLEARIVELETALTQIRDAAVGALGGV